MGFIEFFLTHSSCSRHPVSPPDAYSHQTASFTLLALAPLVQAGQWTHEEPPIWPTLPEESGVWRSGRGDPEKLSSRLEHELSRGVLKVRTVRTGSRKKAMNILERSGGSKYSSDEDSDDDTPSDLRGRAFSEKRPQDNSSGGRYSSHSVRRRSPHGASSGDSAKTIRREKRDSFARSRSPALAMLRASSRKRHLSPSVARIARQVPVPHKLRYILSSEIRLRLSLPFTPFAWTFCIDKRRAGENAILLASILGATYLILQYPTPIIPMIPMEDSHRYLALGMSSVPLFNLCSCTLRALYTLWYLYTILNLDADVVLKKRIVNFKYFASITPHLTSLSARWK